MADTSGAQPPYLSHVLDQMDQLLVKRRGAKNLNKESTGKEDPALLSELRRSLRIVTNAIVVFSKNNLPPVCEALKTLAERYPYQPPVKVAKPGTTDQPETVESIVDDDSAQYTVLRAMNLAFRNNDASEIAKVSPAIVTFVFGHLPFTFSAAIKHQATKTLSALSVAHLGPVLELVDREMTNIRKPDDERGFVPYQRAVALLHFEVVSEPGQNHLTNYLARVVRFMDGVKRGVLKQSLCHSLATIFMNLVKVPANSPPTGWTEFSTSAASKAFWRHYTKIFESVSKWAKTKKHTPFCVHLLGPMLCCSTAEFFHSSAENYMKILVSECKDKGGRRGALDVAAKFFAELPPVIIERERGVFEKATNLLLAVMFPKKANPPKQEQDLLQAVLFSLSNAHIGMAINCVQTLLKSNSYTADQKAVGLRMLSSAKAENKAVIFAASFEIVPLLEPIIEAVAQTKDLTLIRAALPCFPSVLNQYLEKSKQTATHIAGLAMHPDREVSSAAAMSVQNHVLAAPEHYFLPILSVLTWVLADTDMFQEELMARAFKNIQVVLNAYVEVARSGKPLDVEKTDPAQWFSARTHLEGIVLLWLVHPEPWIQNEAYTILELLSMEPLRQTEAKFGTTFAPWLSDYIKRPDPVVAASMPIDQLPADLEKVLTTRWEEHADCLTWAWSQLAIHQWNIFLPEFANSNIRTPQNIALWRNRLRFMCGALRFDSAQFRTLDVDRRTLGRGNAAQRNARLEAFSPPLVHVFLGQLISILNGDNSDTINEVVSAIASMDGCCYKDFLNRLQEDELKNRMKKNIPKMGEDDVNFITNEKVLIVVQRMASRVGPPPLVLNSPPEALIEVVGDMITKWLHPKRAGLIAGLPVTSRAAAAGILDRHLYFIDPKCGREGSTLRVTSVLDFIKGLLASPSAIGPAAADLDSRLVGALATLLDWSGPLNDAPFELELLEIISRSPVRGPHVAQNVRLALRNMLRHHPHLLVKFFQSAYVGVQTPNGPVPPEIRVFFADAIASNFASLSAWLSLGVHPSRVLYTALQFMLNPAEEVRGHGIALAKILASHGSTHLDVAQHLPSLSHESMLMYVEAVCNYSKAVADNYPGLTVSLLQEAVFFGEWLSNAQRAVTLQVLIPWIRNLRLFHNPEIPKWNEVVTPGAPLSYADVEGEESSNSIPNGIFYTPAYANSQTLTVTSLEAMFALTRQAVEKKQWHAITQQFWTVMLAGLEPSEVAGLVEITVQFLLDRYAMCLRVRDDDKAEAAARALAVEDLLVAELVVVYLARTFACDKLITTFVAQMRSYDYDTASDSDAYLSVCPKPEPATVELRFRELAAFCLLIDVMFEQDNVFLPVLPVMLQNAFVLYGSSYGANCGRFLAHVVHSLGVRWASSNTERNELLKDFHVDQAGNTVSSSTPQNVDMELTAQRINTRVVNMPCLNTGDYNADSTRILRLVQILAEQRQSISRDWVAVCLKWAVQAANRDTILRSLRLFSVLASKVDGRTVHALSMTAFIAVRDGDIEIVNTIMDILTGLIAPGTPNDAMALAVDVAAVCLGTQCMAMYATAAKLLNKAISVEGGAKVFVRIRDVWQGDSLTADFGYAFGTHGAEQSRRLDEVLVSVFLVGLSDENTLPMTISLLCEAARAEVGTLPVDNAVLAMTICTFLIQITHAGRALAKQSGAADMARLITTLSEFLASLSYGQVLEPLRNAATLDRKLPKFLSEMGAAMGLVFDSHTTQDLMVDALILLLQGGLVQMRMAIFRVLHTVFEGCKVSFTPEQFTRLADCTVEGYFTPDEELTEAVSAVLAYMNRNVPAGVTNGVFDFLRKPQVYIKPPRPSEKIPLSAVFYYASENVPAQCRRTMLRKLLLLLGINGLTIDSIAPLKAAPRPTIAAKTTSNPFAKKDAPSAAPPETPSPTADSLRLPGAQSTPVAVAAGPPPKPSGKENAISAAAASGRFSMMGASYDPRAAFLDNLQTHRSDSESQSDDTMSAEREFADDDDDDRPPPMYNDDDDDASSVSGFRSPMSPTANDRFGSDSDD